MHVILGEIIIGILFNISLKLFLLRLLSISWVTKFYFLFVKVIKYIDLIETDLCLWQKKTFVSKLHLFVQKLYN